jgi:urease beta subunit
LDNGSFYLVEDGEIELNAGSPTLSLAVANTGDRPVQVGSHAHFFEVNRALRFDRARAFGMRLDIPSGTAVRFEPGDEKQVTLVALGGEHIAMGMQGLVQGAATPEALPAALEAARALGFELEALP